MNIVLLGMKHCGKSTIGRALAERWECPLHDVDDRIEAGHHTETGQPMSVRQIFTTRNEDYFHQIEQRAIRALADELQNSKQQAVLALGGRTPLDQTFDNLLPTLGTCVYLKVNPEELFRRIKQNGLPPFLNTSDPLIDLVRLINRREPAYQRIAELTIELNGLDPAESFDRVLNNIEEYRHGRQ
jgi:shikimate kinase